jgi:glutamate synthase domain-containing protein 3
MTPNSSAVRNVPTGPARRGPTGIEPARITAGQPGTELGVVSRQAGTCRIDACGTYYKTLNEQVREEIENGAATIALDNVNGQRYIGAGLRGTDITLVVNGVPGNDLATFMDGPTVIVNENAQDGVANTMNAGRVVIHGDAGDVLGYGMRGGRLYVRGDVGYRVGIHMKAYEDQTPVIVVGGKARDFFGEYMAGGEMILLGLDGGPEPSVGVYTGTGMHGGRIYVRGGVDPYRLGKEVGVSCPTPVERERIDVIVRDFCAVMSLDAAQVLAEPFVALYPESHRPYGRMYAY